MQAWNRLIGAAFVLVSSQVLADAKSQLDAFVKNTKTLSGSFQQTLLDINGKVSERSSGRLALQAPRQFRWQVQKPSEQLIVADGLNVFSYDVDLEQVTVRAQGEAEANSPLAVLLDPSLLQSQFNIAPSADQNGLQWLKLLPKSKDGDFKEAALGFKNNQLLQMRLFDQLGQGTEIVFRNWKRNNKIERSQFQFVVPKGVDVVGEIKQPADIQKLPD
jgi:outer membrane lipoprotein carrier protein